MNDIFDDLSINLTNKLTSEEKKNEGIYFTSNTIIEPTIKLIKKYLKNKTINILEPSCGSCQFINFLKDEIKYKNIHGVELNKTIFNEIKDLYNDKNIILYNQDFLSFGNSMMYELIIGNPPYFVLNKPKKTKKEEKDYKKKILIYNKKYKKFKKEILKYKKFYDGRVNIYIIFIAKSLELLVDKGILAFVLPKNFLNCLYYDKLKEYINKNYKIIDIVDHSSDKYIDTEQNTCMFILQNCKGDNTSFIYEKNNNIIFNTKSNIEQINSFYEEAKTLDELGFEVSVGKLVWNQNKDILSNDDSKTRLIYNSDIVNNKLQVTSFKDPKKKNYIDKSGIKGPILIVNRGYGKGEYKFNYCLIDLKDKEYLIENHLICIKPKKGMKKEKLIKEYKKIIKSFENKKSSEFVKLYFENNAINTNELQFILPIF